MALTEIDLTLGSVLVGALIGSILYGVVSVQLYTYSGRCQKDPMWLILFVYIIWVMETILTFLSICYIYDLVVTHFGNAANITNAPRTIDMFVAFQGIVGASVQSFFGYRVYKVSRSLIVPILIWFGSLIRVSFSITIAILLIKTGNVAEFSAKYGSIVTISFSVSVAMDILNVVSLSWSLAASRGSSLDKTSRMVDQLILYSIETGLITSVTGICMLATRVTMTDNFVWIGIFEFYAKLYSNTLMASLNARAGLRHKYMSDGVHTMTSIAQSSVSGRQERSGISIQMVSFTETGHPGQKQTQADRTYETESADRISTNALPIKS